MKHILVVDDDPVDRAMAVKSLGKVYDVTGVSSGREALELLEDEDVRCDLVLMDMLMPEMDGFEALRQIHAHPARTETPVVFLTGDDSDETECRCLEMGAVDYILKPFAPAVMRSRISRILETEAQRRHLCDQLQEKIREVSEIRDRAQQDALTGLWNRRYIEACMNARIAEGKRGALFMIDMDNFKAVNDLCGHIVGDEVLKDFADTMRAHAGPEDVLCRIGGDEFVMLVDRDGPSRDLGKLADNIIEDLEQRLAERGMNIHSSVSVGIALFPEDGEEYAGIYSCADKALYYVKQNGKRGYRFYNERRKKDPGRRSAVDLRCLQDMMDRSDHAKGAALLDMEGFRHVYHFIHRFLGRADHDIQVLLFTAEDESRVDAEGMDAALDLLAQTIQSTLRRSDVFTRYSSKQVVTILVDSNDENADMVAQRILEHYHSSCPGSPVDFEYDIAKM